MLLQPCSLLAQLPEAVTQRSRFLLVPKYLRNFFSPFYNTDTKAESGCWGSKARAQASASHSLLLPGSPRSVCIHLWLLSSAKALGEGSSPKPGWELSIKQEAAEERQEEAGLSPACHWDFSQYSKTPRLSANKEQINFSCLYLYSFEYLQISADASKDGYFLQNIKQGLLSSRNLRQRVSDTNMRGQQAG